MNDSKSKFLLLDSWLYDEIMDIDDGSIDFFKFFVRSYSDRRPWNPLF